MAKPYSAPLPLAAIYDTRLAGLDLRVLACIAFHDRMSLATGKGQGCWASHGTLAAEVGCNYINLGKSIKRLGELGYLERTRPTFGDKRGHVYRIPADRYSKEESESFGKRGKDANARNASGKVCHPANSDGELVCHGTQNSHDISSTSPEQYISLSDVRYSAEAEEDIHLKVRAAEATRSNQDEIAQSDHAQLARLDRALKAQQEGGQSIATDSLIAWNTFIEDVLELGPDEDAALYGRAQRLSETVYTCLWERNAPGFGDEV